MKTYLGDSVYASYDGENITLTTENGLPTDPSNKIVIEPQIWEALKTVVKFIDVKNETSEQKTEPEEHWPDSQSDWS